MHIEHEHLASQKGLKSLLEAWKSKVQATIAQTVSLNVSQNILYRWVFTFVLDWGDRKCNVRFDYVLLMEVSEVCRKVNQKYHIVLCYYTCIGKEWQFHLNVWCNAKQEAHVGHCRSPEYNERVKNLTSEWNQKQQSFIPHASRSLLFIRFVAVAFWAKKHFF